MRAVEPGKLMQILRGKSGEQSLCSAAQICIQNQSLDDSLAGLQAVITTATLKTVIILEIYCSFGHS